MHSSRLRMLTPLRGLVFWDGQGGCDNEFAQKILRFPGNLADAQQDIRTTFQAREQAALAHYVSFVKQHGSQPAARARQSTVDSFYGRR